MALDDTYQWFFHILRINKLSNSTKSSDMFLVTSMT